MHALSGSFLRFPGDTTASQLARYPAARTYTLLVKYVSCAWGARNIFSLLPAVFREKLYSIYSYSVITWSALNLPGCAISMPLLVWDTIIYIIKNSYLPCLHDLSLSVSNQHYKSSNFKTSLKQQLQHST